MSTLYVDTITEKTSGNGVQIPGHVIQVKQVNWTTTGSSSSTSFVSMGEIGSITTTATNSKILVTTNMPLQLSSSAYSQALLEIRNSLDSYTNYLERHFAVGAPESSGGYTMEHLGWNTLHDAQQPAGTTISYRTYYKLVNGSGAYYIDGWGQSGLSYKCTLMEIAQ